LLLGEVFLCSLHLDGVFEDDGLHLSALPVIIEESPEAGHNGCIQDQMNV
jgi:hypothetical protein